MTIFFGDALLLSELKGVVLLAARTAALSCRYALKAGAGGSDSLSNILEAPFETINVLLMKDRTVADSVTGLRMSAERSLMTFCAEPLLFGNN